MFTKLSTLKYIVRNKVCKNMNMGGVDLNSASSVEAVFARMNMYMYMRILYSAISRVASACLDPYLPDAKA